MSQVPEETRAVGVRRPSHPAARLRRIAGFVAGLLLLAAAVWAVAVRGDAFEQAAGALRHASPIAIAGVFVLPLVNWFLTSVLFWVLTERYGRVRLSEMTALIGAAWLLNLLPFRPGLFGRLAYHKAVNRIAVADSIRVLVAAAGCTLLAMMMLLAVAVYVGRHGGIAIMSAALLAPIAVISVAGAALKRSDTKRAARGLRVQRQPWRLAAATAIRYADTLVWAVRYLLLFSMIGRPIGPGGAVAIALASQLAALTPIQFGLREWVVGATRAMLPAAWVGGAAGVQATQGALIGVTADLVNRGVEIVLVVPVGLACSLWLARHKPASVRPGSGASDRTSRRRDQ